MFMEVVDKVMVTKFMRGEQLHLQKSSLAQQSVENIEGRKTILMFCVRTSFLQKKRRRDGEECEVHREGFRSRSGLSSFMRVN